MKIACKTGVAAEEIDLARHAEPPVGQKGPKGVLAHMQLPGDIVGLVKHPLFVDGPSRRKSLVADLLPVEPEFIAAEGGGVENGAPDRLADDEFLAQVGHG